MAYETKVILSLIAQLIGKAETLKEAYEAVIKAANIEDMQLPSYETYKKELEDI